MYTLISPSPAPLLTPVFSRGSVVCQQIDVGITEDCERHRHQHQHQHQHQQQHQHQHQQQQLLSTTQQQQQQQRQPSYHLASRERELIMQQLFDMGFYDRSLNASLLLKHNDVIPRVVEELLGNHVDNTWFTRRH